MVDGLVFDLCELTATEARAKIRLVADVTCADPEKFVRGVPTLTTFFLVLFLVDEGIEDQNTIFRRTEQIMQRNPIIL